MDTRAFQLGAEAALQGVRLNLHHELVRTPQELREWLLGFLALALGQALTEFSRAELECRLAAILDDIEPSIGQTIEKLRRTQ